MSLKLEELRKRLLQQPQGDGANGSPAAQVSSSAPAPEEAKNPERPAPKAELKAVEPKAAEPTVVKTVEITSAKERDRPASPKAEASPAAPPAAQKPSAVSMPKMENFANQDLVAESVAKLFEQTKTFQVRFDELAQAIDLIERMADSAGRLFGPLRNFHGQLSQLAVSFESMRAFQTQLAQLGKTFEPMKLLHDQLAQLSEGLQTHLAQLVKALDPAKDFRDRILALARSLEQASELQADFGELYSAFRAVGSPSAAVADPVDGMPEARQRAV